ncbi:MAG: hypothetical protein OEY01_03440 [Desulfobulbaceae bacterium]|nr:hypothetical protein [Desulfobulbaceae bacterium]
MALAAGGMDLSWDICEAYISLGYYPPAHYCDLPRMAGRGLSPKDKATIKTCKESIKVVMEQFQARIDHLTEMENREK